VNNLPLGIFNSILKKNIVLVEENLIIGVYEGEITEDIPLINLVICILTWVIWKTLKWVIWKTRNYIKYNNSTKVLLFLTHISFILNILFLKND
jgi:hypothetical protein